MIHIHSKINYQLRSHIFTKRKFLISVLLGVSMSLFAQEKEAIHVITKHIQKTFPYATGFEVNLEGDNAEVFVESWDRAEIQVHIELVAKHPEKAVAEKELERITYQAERFKRRIYIRNYVKSESALPVKAILKANYYLKVPADCPVYLKNAFGSTNVKDLANKLRIFSEFTNIQLDNIQGTVEMNSKYGDIRGDRLMGNFDIESRHANINLHDIVGNYNINAQYGTINLWAGKGLIDLNIIANKADVNLFNIDPKTHQQQLFVEYGKLSIPNGWQFKFVENTSALKHVTFKPNQEYFANITINVAFGDLAISGKK